MGEFRSCMTVEVVVQGSPSLTVPMDVTQNLNKKKKCMCMSKDQICALKILESMSEFGGL